MKVVAALGEKEKEGEERSSCTAQQETFNSVTPGLNYHAETIVSGKIKKGVLSASSARAIVFSMSDRGEERDAERACRVCGREKGPTTKSLFRLQQRRLLRSV